MLTQESYYENSEVDSEHIDSDILLWAEFLEFSVWRRMQQIDTCGFSQDIKKK